MKDPIITSKIINNADYLLNKHRLRTFKLHVNESMKNNIRSLNSTLTTEEEISEYWLKFGYLLGRLDGDK